MARKVTKALGGAGIFGVEFFICDDGVVFSELSPRPHDTGMVTLAGTQNLNEFELHARAILGLCIPEIEFIRPGASAVILAKEQFLNPDYTGVNDVLCDVHADIRIFGKPEARVNRRMGVVVAWDKQGTKAEEIKKRARELADKVAVVKR